MKAQQANKGATAKPKPKRKAVDIKAARSWKGKIIRDVQVNQLGLIVDAVEKKEGVRLLARFKDIGLKQPEERLIALEPTADLECLVPDMVKARYRLAQPEDLARARSTANG